MYKCGKFNFLITVGLSRATGFNTIFGKKRGKCHCCDKQIDLHC